MEPQKFSIRSRIKSFAYAIAGLKTFIIREHNARIHLVATIAVIVTACILKTTKEETIALTIVTGLVWITELLNTCIERMADMITKEIHPQIKFIKDLAAAAVLISAGIAVIVGLLIFIPKLK